MNILITLLNLFLIFNFGYILVGRKSSNYERFGLSWLIGSAIISYTWFLSYRFLGFSFNLLHLTILLVILNALIIFYKGHKIYPSKFINNFQTRLKNHVALIKKWDVISQVLLSSIIVVFLFSIFQNIFLPITDWDALALYDFRARVISETGTFDEGIKLGYFLQYPPYTSILHAIIYVGKMEIAKIWYSILFGSFLLVFYSLLRRFRTRTTSLLGTLFVATSPLMLSHSIMAYTNLPYSIFLVLGYIYLLFWTKKGIKYDLYIGSALVAFTTLIRLTEPFWILSIFLIILGYIKHRSNLMDTVTCMIMLVYLKIPWTSFVAFHESRTPEQPLAIIQSVASDSNSFSPSNIFEVSIFLYQSVLPVVSIFLPAVLISFVSVILFKKWSKLIDFTIYFLFLGMIFYGTLLFSQSYPEWKNIPDSAARMAMFLLPYSIYLIFLSPIFRSEKLNVKK